MKYDKLKDSIEKACEEEGVDINEIFCIPEHSLSEEIGQVEEYLGVRLPDSYRWFLETYGSGGMETFDFFGIEGGREDVASCTVVYVTENYRKKGMEQTLVVIQDLGEYVRCIDTGQSDERGEAPIVNWSCHVNGKVVTEKDSFLNYFLEVLEDYI
ncbi:MAG: SMI1/KNR4 family protein [Lachnospiraceae bacterium]